ncbi:MAG: hypothetical protein AAGC97_03360 [Planctomycetota bacterium]
MASCISAHAAEHLKWTRRDKDSDRLVAMPCEGLLRWQVEEHLPTAATSDGNIDVSRHFDVIPDVVRTDPWRIRSHRTGVEMDVAVPIDVC